MKNINTKKGNFIKRGLIALLISLFVLVVPYLAILWVLNDYDPDFLSIDSCLDAGGRWDDDLDKCEKAPPGLQIN